MSLFQPHEWAFVKEARELVTTNPFHPSWREQEATILGLPQRNAPEVISWRPGVQLWGPQSVYPDVLDRRIHEMVDGLRRRLQGGTSASEAEWGQYELLAVYRLYCEYGREMDRRIGAAVQGDGHESDAGGPPHDDEPPPDLKALWRRFHREHGELFRFNNGDFPTKYKPEHLFACFFLFRRAYYHIFFNIVGGSKQIAKLRGHVWESIVTHDLLGWMQGLYRRMKDVPTLITGESGTGKERAAEAVGRSLYVPFNQGTEAFETDFLTAYSSVNLSALPPSLIESELFGHVKGAFTDAIERIGRLEKCPENGAVFLDEIGETTAEVQVKLLRVLQTRRFQSVGANEDKTFHGKIVAATNRDLVAAMEARRFREDFYYRLCADTIETPSLREQLADCPEDLPLMVGYVCRAVVGEEKAVQLAPEVVGWIEQRLRGYSWPGNFRELEQCVRSYTIRKDYRPIQPARPRTDDGSPRPPCDPVAEACQTLAQAVLKLKATCAEIELKQKKVFDQIKRRLFTLVRDGTRTKQEAAALLGIDVRTLEAGTKATDRRPTDG